MHRSTSIKLSRDDTGKIIYQTVIKKWIMDVVGTISSIWSSITEAAQVKSRHVLIVVVYYGGIFGFLQSNTATENAIYYLTILTIILLALMGPIQTVSKEVSQSDGEESDSVQDGEESDSVQDEEK